MSDDPYIDFDGDGVGDDYETETLDDGTVAYSHVGEDGEVDAIAYDEDGDGLIDALAVDTDGDGTLDAIQEDVDGDGIMDTETALETEDDAVTGDFDFDGLLGGPLGEDGAAPEGDDTAPQDDTTSEEPVEETSEDPAIDSENPLDGIPNPFVN